MIGGAIDELETPFLAVDLDRLERNIATMRRVIIEDARIGWRPHIKAIKVPAIAHMLLAAGAHGVTCAKLSEAEVMAAAGLRDILIANQVVTPKKMARLAALARYTEVIVAADSEDLVKALNSAAGDAGVRLRVVVEVDMGIHRAGVEPGEMVLELAQTIAAQPHLRFAGIMGWEGQTAPIADKNEKRDAVVAAVGRFTGSAELCRQNGLAVEIVSCGGTGTYWITAGIPGVTEVQAGGGIFCDLRYHNEFGVQHEYAMSVWTTVISRPTAARIICDTGWKAMSCYPRYPEPLRVGEVTSLKMAAEHATIELAVPAREPRVGDRVEFVVGYADSTVCLHDSLYGVRNGKVEVIWPIIGRGKVQ